MEAGKCNQIVGLLSAPLYSSFPNWIGPRSICLTADVHVMGCGYHALQVHECCNLCKLFVLSWREQGNLVLASTERTGYSPLQQKQNLQKNISTSLTAKKLLAFTSKNIAFRFYNGKQNYCLYSTRTCLYSKSNILY